jgi:LysM repeat protein
MNRIKRLIWISILLVALVPMGVSAAPPQQGENLLQNPSFEGTYTPWNAVAQIQVPTGWTPWWGEAAEGDPDWKNQRPEWKPAEGVYYPTRVHSGERAIQWHKSYATFLAGAYQQVNVPENAPLRFSAYGQAWSCSDWNQCQDSTSYDPANVGMRIGIDPTGGTNPWAASVVWSAWGNPLDTWAPFSVEATAQGSVVTVFLYSNPDWPKQNQDVYYDDASLVVIGAAPPPAPETTAPSTEPSSSEPVTTSAPSIELAAPREDGSIVHVVQAGETAWSIAARYGITMDELNALNEIGAFIQEGQELLIRAATEEGSGEAASEEPAVEEVAVEETTVEEAAGEAAGGGVEETTAEEASTEEVEMAAAPETVEFEEMNGGVICVSAFDDSNSNGVRDASEGLLSGIEIAVSNSLQELGSYTTDGVSEPYCFSGLLADSYQVAQRLSDEWTATTLAAWGISLQDGDTINLEFGNAVSQSTGKMAGENAADVTAEPDEEESGGMLRTSLLAGAGVFGILLIAGAVLFLVYSRRGA